MSLSLAAAMVASGIPAGWLAGHMARLSLEGRADVSAPLSPRTPTLLAMATPAMFLLVGWALGETWVLAAFLVFTAVTMALAVTDLHARLIPDALNLPGTAVAAVLLGAGAILDGDADHLVRAVIGGAVYYGFLLLVWLVTRGRSMGGGDVKLAFALGLFTAYLGWDILILAIFLGILTGGITGIVLVAARLRRLQEHFAYGPALVLGAYVAVIWGGDIMRWYLR